MESKQLSIIASALALLAAACSSREENVLPERLETPSVRVSDITPSSFVLRWDRVEHAGTYSCKSGSSEAEITDTTVISCSGLERNVEYAVEIVALPKDPSSYAPSLPAYVHVFTSDMEQLDTPVITFGCTYASKTIINWSQVPGAASYTYEIDGQTGSVTENRIELNTLRKGRTYTFRVKAVSSDEALYSDSAFATGEFTTEAGDVPSIIISPVSAVADAATFEIFAMPDLTYYYTMISGPAFLQNDEETIMDAYRNAVIAYAEEQGISLSLALGSVLRSGSGTYKITALVPQLTYYIIAFGMDLKGNITTSLCSARIKTLAFGESYGPTYGGTSWFRQEAYITNLYAATGYGETNSVWSSWTGNGVTSLKYRILATDTFNSIFPDVHDETALKAFLNNPSYAHTVSDENLVLVNSAQGLNMVSAAYSATSYTLMALAVNGAGEEALCVNSVSTRADHTDRAWFTVGLGTNETYGPAYNTLLAVMRGAGVTSVRYVALSSASIEGVSVSRYPDIVRDLGHDVSEQGIPYIASGYGIILSPAEPETSYTFIATAVNRSGDEVTKYATASTSAAPEGISPAPAAGLGIRSVLLPSDPGKVVELDIPGDDPWTIIHNMKPLER